MPVILYLIRKREVWDMFFNVSVTHLWWEVKLFQPHTHTHIYLAHSENINMFFEFPSVVKRLSGDD